MTFEHKKIEYLFPNLPSDGTNTVEASFFE